MLLAKSKNLHIKFYITFCLLFITNKQIKVINQANDAKKQLVGNIKKIGVSKTPLNTVKIKEIKKMDKQINRDKKSDEREAKKQQEKTSELNEARSRASRPCPA